MGALESASGILIPPDSDDTMIDNIIQLRQTIIATYSMFVHSNFEVLVNKHFNALLHFLELVWADTEFRTKKLVQHIILLIR